MRVEAKTRLRLLSMSYSQNKAEDIITGAMFQLIMHLGKIFAIDCSEELRRKWQDEISDKYLFSSWTYANNLKTKTGVLSKNELTRLILENKMVFPIAARAAYRNHQYKNLKKRFSSVDMVLECSQDANYNAIIPIILKILEKDPKKLDTVAKNLINWTESECIRLSNN